MKHESRIFVAGHKGAVGSALIHSLKERGYKNIITRQRSELDLTDQAAVKKFFQTEKPEYVFLAAGRTGGIFANTHYQAQFLYENLQIQTNVIHQSFLGEVKRLFFFGCSSMYPVNCPQPMKEDDILTGPFEATNESFAVAKVAGMRMCDAYNRQFGTSFLTFIPTNLYGPGMKYEPMDSIVVPSLLMRFHKAKEENQKSLHVWGDGEALRDFLYTGDLAEATIFIAENYLGTKPFNIGTGSETSIKDLAFLIKEITNFTGEIEFDTSRPSGVSRKLQEISRIDELGWKAKITLEDGLEKTYQDYLKRLGVSNG